MSWWLGQNKSIMMWNITFTPLVITRSAANDTKHSDTHTRSSRYIQYVETSSRATNYQGASTSLTLVRASVWVGCRRTRCSNTCTHLMRRDGRIEKVWRVCVFVCNIITGPRVMTKTWERATDGDKAAVCVRFVFACVFRVLHMSLLIFLSAQVCGVASVNRWNRKIGDVSVILSSVLSIFKAT